MTKPLGIWELRVVRFIVRWRGCASDTVSEHKEPAGFVAFLLLSSPPLPTCLIAKDSRGGVHSQPPDQHGQRRDGCQLDAHHGYLRIIIVASHELGILLDLRVCHLFQNTMSIRRTRQVCLVGNIGASRACMAQGFAVETVRRHLVGPGSCFSLEGCKGVVRIFRKGSRAMVRNWGDARDRPTNLMRIKVAARARRWGRHHRLLHR